MGRENQAAVICPQDGSIVAKSERLPKLAEKYPLLRVPVLRGSAVLIHSMLLGIKALNFSATVAFEEQPTEEEIKKIEPALEAAAVTGALMTTAHAIEAPHQFDLPRPTPTPSNTPSKLFGGSPNCAGLRRSLG